ncbi:Crp/Fnr family transcriptional regulator [Aureimonas ureilytica]|uniref:Crp/Fnr family transcriptional regulator n=1 Tax=Aureimonas ureilytica TaxID=401562 RepID=UPI000A565A47|nr:helix-turn-helix domain-containing protein [Aureimonas ureilytica]
MAVCAAMEEDEIGALERIMTGRRLQADEVLVEEGEPRRRVYSLTDGMLRLSIALPDGRRQITGFLLPGDYLGLADDETYSATVEAVTPSALCSFPVREMEALVDSHPKLKDRLFRFTRAALRQARENQLILGRLAPVEKLAAFLLALSRRLEEHRLPDNPIPLAMTRTDIADYLGLTVETVSRSFTKLRNSGLIRLPDAHLVDIIDRPSLEAVAGTLR